MKPIYILTNDKHLWLLRGYAYLHNVLWGSPVNVFGFSPPDFDLPNNFTFTSLGKQQSVNQWSNALIEMIEQIEEKFFILMLEDYWLKRPVNTNSIDQLFKIMPDENVLRIDLSGNRAAYKHYSIIKTDDFQVIKSNPNARYQMSFQAAIWNRELILKILRKDENPWQSEIDGSARVKASRMSVWGTKPAILKYKPVYRARQKKLVLDGIPFQKAMKKRRII